MKRSIIIALHIAYWVVYIFLTISTLVVAGNNFTGNAYQSFFLNTFLAVGCFYSFYLVLVPKYLASRKIKFFVCSAVAVCIVSAMIVTLIHVLLLRYQNLPTNADNPALAVIINWFIVIAFQAIIGLVHGLLATFMKGFFTWYDDIHIRELLERKNTETQMSLIKAKINPHFLFNTLNNIDMLIKNDAASASLYLQKLCNILRFALYENQSEWITLEKEISIMREYIDLESIRAINKDFISLEVRDMAGGIIVAPMLFIPFLENAVKHSGNRKMSGVIVVSLDVSIDGAISFVCRNLISQQKQITSDGGLGIDLIKQRLSLLYPDKHELSLQKENDYFEVRLTIKTK